MRNKTHLWEANRTFLFAFYFIILSFTYSYSDDFADKLHKINESKLWEHPRWLRLLHMNSSMGRCSDFDGGQFFIHKEGRCDAKKEFIATLKAFLSPNSLLKRDSILNPFNLHPLAKYRARVHFFKELGLIQESELPQVDLSVYHRWITTLNPRAAKVVFATGYFGNPASIMGHTFLQFDTKGNTGATKPLNYAITFSANRGADRGFTYAWKGLFGGYPGTYNMLQYHVHKQKYLYSESRDLWEYELNLTQNELNYMLEHLWETGSTYHNYYFFTENCSYGLLTLLEASSLRLNFSEIKSGIIVPVETLKAIQKIPNLLKKPSYHPALKKKFFQRASALNSQQKKLLKQLLDPNKLDTTGMGLLPKIEVSETLDAVLDYYQIKARKKGSNNPWKKSQLQLYKYRLNYPAGDFGNSQVPTPEESPDQIHGPEKLSYEIGIEQSALKHSLSYRLGYHNLNQNPIGFDRGLELELLNIKISWTPGQVINNTTPIKTKTVELDYLTLIKAGSISPVNEWEKPLTWSGEMTLRRKDYQDRHPGLLTSIGIGYAIGSTKPNGLLFYGIPEVRAWYIPTREFDAALEPGMSIGLYKEWFQSFSFSSKMGLWRDVLKMNSVDQELDTSLRWSPSIDSEVNLFTRFQSKAIQYGIGTGVSF